jgi:tetratricopeptide (TPR) repeat protein
VGGLIGFWMLGLALAQDAPAPESEARSLFLEGRSSYELGRYEDAIAKWESAWRLSQRNLLLFNLANAYERAGMLSEALEHLTRYRTAAPSEEHVALDTRVAFLEARLASQLAEADRESAEVLLREAEKLAESRRLTAQLQQDRLIRNDTQARDVPVATWLATGVGVAGLATGIVATLAASKTRTEVSDTCVQDGSSTLCPSYATGLLDQHQSQRTLAWAGYGTALVGLGVTTLLVVTPVELGVQWEVRW